MPVADLVTGLLGMVGILVLIAAVLEYAYRRLGDGRTVFDRRRFAFAAFLTVAISVLMSWDRPALPGPLLMLLGIALFGFKDGGFYSGKPKPLPPVADLDFDSLQRQDSSKWIGRFDTGGPEPTEVFLEAGVSGPSARQRQDFLAFRAAYPALEGRIMAVLDPYGEAPPGDWWLACVDFIRPPGDESIELTYESRSTLALRSIELQGDLSAPTIVEVTSSALQQH